MSGPSFSMPAIGPPPSGTDAEQHYQSVLAQLNVSVTENATNEGLTVQLSPPTDSNAELYATNPAQAAYVPPGTTHTIGPAAGTSGAPVEVTTPTDAGALVLERIGGSFVSGLDQPGLPRYGYVIYTGVEERTVRTAFEPAVKRLPLAELEAKWTQQTSVGRATLEGNYLDQFIQGAVYLVVTEGQSIGRPAQVDTTDPTSPRQFEFRLISPQDGGGTFTELRPLPFLRAIAASKPSEYAGHPLITAAGSLQQTAEFHVRFELWSPDSTSATPSPGYVPLRSGVEVALMVDDIASDTEVTTATTDTNGTVAFLVSDPADALGESPDIYFVARTNGRQQAGHTLSDEWSTNGWTNESGTPGLLEDYVGTQFGTQATPVTYRLGVDYHFDLQFRNPASKAAQRLPPGMTAELQVGGETVAQHETTTSTSEAEGVIFDISPGDTLALVVPARITNSGVKQDMAVFWNGDFDRFVVPDNLTFTLPATDPSGGRPRIRYDGIDRQTFGSHASLRSVEARDSGAEAVYFLKLGYELCSFFSLMTNGSWKGLEGITITPYAPANAFSWPEGYVWIDENSVASRNTVLHELAHQILWRELEISEVIVEALAASQLGENWLRNFFGTLDTDVGEALGWGSRIEWYNHILHSSDLLGNPYNSLIEGWPYFISGIFASGNHPPNPGIVGPNARLRRIDELMNEVGYGSGAQRLGPPPLDRGESAEGAFTNAMSLLFEEHVLGPVRPSPHSHPLIPEPSNHEITSTASWVTDGGVQQRFREIIWEPLLALRGITPAQAQNATVLLRETRNNNQGRWHELAATLQAFNMSNDSPEVTGVDPPTAPVGTAQSTAVTIEGDNFVAGRTAVTFGSTASPAVTVTNSTELTAAVPPGSSAGSVDLTVTVDSQTPSGATPTWTVGSKTITDGFTYI